MRPLASRVAHLALTASLAVTVTLAAQPARADALSEGDVAAKQGNWEKALTAYQKADEATPSAKTKLRVADALYQLGRVREAHQAYVDLLAKYEKKLFLLDLRKAKTRRDELAAKLGQLELRVSEVGASVTIDGNVIGTSPISAPIDLAAGPHELEVSKQGFTTAKQTVTVEAKKKASVEVRLEPLVASGKIAVSSATGPMKVLIDGDEVGTTPFTGDLTPGEHTVQGVLDGVKTPVQTISVDDGETAEVTLEPAREGRLEVRIEGDQGTIFVDGEQVGEGSFEGALPAGEHTIRVEREGYEAHEATLTIVAGDLRAETVTLRKQAAGQIDTTSDVEAADAASEYDGFYGGIHLGASFLPIGTGSAFEDDCPTVGATSCDPGTSVGGALSGYLGYSFDPVGLELYVRGGGDVVQPVASFDGVTGSDVNPLLAAPAREENFTIARAGGGGAIRVRLLFPFEPVRLTTAIGAGMAYRQFFIARDTQAADGGTSTAAPEADGYLSGVLSVEAGVQFSVSDAVALGVGFDLWLEHAGDGVRSSRETDNFITGGGIPAPQATPAYDLATTTQLYLGPYLGMQFGP